MKPAKKKRPVCRECKGSNLLFEGDIMWDIAKQEFSIVELSEGQPLCNDCGQGCYIEWQEVTS